MRLKAINSYYELPPQINLDVVDDDDEFRLITMLISIEESSCPNYSSLPSTLS